ncbi:uncharacterized protein LOC117329174 [Pecten maximus]|uniref:uncharacterized protein LOC117329174 n=1 Tax=Pecten maximus TaxID=6579 RepID=UPI001458E85F|nr:uncharacterized protein LOC117329174 [Pecten maximus]
MNVARLGKANLVLGVAAIVIEIIAFSTRGWIRFRIEIQTGQGNYAEIPSIFEFGLWSASVCIKGMCVVLKHNDWEAHESVDAFADILNIAQYQVLTSLAVGLGVVGLLFLGLHFRRPVLSSKCNGMLSIGCFFISGVLMWYVIGKFAKLALNLHPILSQAEELTAITPFSVVLAAIGASFSFVVAILLVLEVFKTAGATEGGIVVNRQQHTLLSINHQTNVMPPPVVSQTTHISMHNACM